MAADKQPQQYRVLCWGACKTPGNGPCGLNYPPGKRAVEGDVVDDLPAVSIRWLLSEGHIEPYQPEQQPAEEVE